MPTGSLFISGVQKELQDERRAVKAFVEGDPLRRRCFTVFLFEDLLASGRRAPGVCGLVFRWSCFVVLIVSEKHAIFLTRSRT